MKTYELWFHGLGGEDNWFEGYIHFDFTEEELERVKASYRDSNEAFENDPDLDDLYERIMVMAADFALCNFENVPEILEQYGGECISNDEAMLRYIEDQGISVPFPEEITEEVDEEEDDE